MRTITWYIAELIPVQFTLLDWKSIAYMGNWAEGKHLAKKVHKQPWENNKAKSLLEFSEESQESDQIEDMVYNTHSCVGSHGPKATLEKPNLDLVKDWNID